jgi:Chaperone of endosialidase
LIVFITNPFLSQTFEAIMKNRTPKPLHPKCLLALVSLCAVSATTQAVGTTASRGVPFATKPDALLQIDMNRSSVVEKIVDTWKGEIPAAQIDSFRSKLSALRADQLLAANVSGSFDGVLEVVNRQELALLTRSEVGDQSKSVGAPDEDLIYTPIAPCRIVDTRSASAAGIPNPMLGNVAYGIKSFSGTGFASYGGSATDCALPNIGEVRAIVANVIGLQQAGLPNFTAYVSVGGSNVLPTLLSNAALNFNALQGANATVVIPTNATGNLYMAMPTGLRGNFIVEVSGYFMPPSRNGDGLRVVWGGTGNAVSIVNGESNNTTGGAVGSTISGGFSNSALANNATIGGGATNNASGGISTIAGGDNNTSSGERSTISGGGGNTASGPGSTIAGGFQNRASGGDSFVGGGINNTVSARQSSAFGHNALADTENCANFALWQTTTTAVPCRFNSMVQISGVNGLVVNYIGQNAGGQSDSWVGIGWNTGIQINTSSSATLTNGGVWTNASDRAKKENFSRTNPASVLQKVLALPVTTWNYIKEGKDIKRMGPMAQDFRAAFGLGSDDKTIGTVDATGVTFAAIQGLNQKLEAESSKSKAKDAKISAQAEKLSALERELTVIKKKLGL